MSRSDGLWARFLRWLDDLSAERPTPFNVGGDGHMAVVGESFHARELDRITGGGIGQREVLALIERDRTNRADGAAIKVVVDGLAVGHLSRENASRFARKLEELGGRATCPALIRRREKDHHWGVVLRVDYDVLEGRKAPEHEVPPSDWLPPGARPPKA